MAQGVIFTLPFQSLRKQCLVVWHHLHLLGLIWDRVESSSLTKGFSWVNLMGHDIRGVISTHRVICGKTHVLILHLGLKWIYL